MFALNPRSVLLAGVLLSAVAVAQSKQGAQPSKRLLTPQNSAVLFIDHQPQMSFAVGNIDRGVLLNNTVGLAKAAKAFKVPTVLTTVAAKSFSGPIFPELQAVFPEQKPIDRTTMNSWEDVNFHAAVKKTNRKKLVMAGLWTEVCVVMPALSAIDEGYEVYVVTDASGGTTKEAHDMAVQRMVQAGAIPVTWMQVLLEYQRDWARGATYEATTGIAKQHGGAYGTGIFYAKEMFNAQEGGKAANAH
ncbi:hydrolase [Myxococcus sp. SDU36]|uniref:hydrolase n=1 Tax=Myxococcus sp. SDU36 TaxID=2831967 RepID=UPI00254282D3|nr:hydrolase [Myxococcus sp. SDU36]WIG98850.1 hydrolase [Myxococcus sp. SDU36]